MPVRMNENRLICKTSTQGALHICISLKARTCPLQLEQYLTVSTQQANAQAINIVHQMHTVVSHAAASQSLSKTPVVPPTVPNHVHNAPTRSRQRQNLPHVGFVQLFTLSKLAQALGQGDFATVIIIVVIIAIVVIVAFTRKVVIDSRCA